MHIYNNKKNCIIKYLKTNISKQYQYYINTYTNLFTSYMFKFYDICIFLLILFKYKRINALNMSIMSTNFVKVYKSVLSLNYNNTHDTGLTL